MWGLQHPMACHVQAPTHGVLLEEGVLAGGDWGALV